MVEEKGLMDSEILLLQERERVNLPPRPLEVNTPKPSTRSKPQVQTYEPQPVFTTTSAFVLGAFIILLSSIWTPLAVAFVWIAARFQRYCFRQNDEPSVRRRLLKDFQRTDQLTAPLRQIPVGVKVEESYWVNRRYVPVLHCDEIFYGSAFIKRTTSSNHS